MYVAMGDYDKGIQAYQQLAQQNPGDPNVRAQIENIQIEKFLSKNDTAGAAGEIRRLIAAYGTDSNGAFAANVQALQMRLMELTGQQDNTIVDSSQSQPGSVGEAGALGR
jgi:hypothetical protein